jgi:hypothetical protein
MKVYKQLSLTGEISVTVHGESKQPVHKLFTSEAELEIFLDHYSVRDYTSLVIKQLNLIPIDRITSEYHELRSKIQCKLIADSTEAYKAEIINMEAIEVLEKFFPQWPRLEEVKQWSLDFYTRNKNKIVEYGVSDRISFQAEREASGYQFTLSK